MPDKKHKHYKLDGVLYRKPSDATFAGVYEIQNGENWEPYDGDAMAPVIFGSPAEDPAGEGGD